MDQVRSTKALYDQRRMHYKRSLKDEAIVNTRPLIYVDNELKPRKIITPMDFLSMNRKVGLPATVNDHEDDPDYNINNLSSPEKLLEIWKKGQRHLQEFLKIWKSDYLLNLRERSQINNKHPRVQSSQEPKVGDIAQVKKIPGEELRELDT